MNNQQFLSRLLDEMQQRQEEAHNYFERGLYEEIIITLEKFIS